MFDRLPGHRAVKNLAPGVVVLLTVPLGLFLDEYGQYVLAVTLGAVVVGAALTMLVGFARCITLATGAMMAIGAYCSSLLVIELGVPFLLAVVVAGVAGGIGGFILAVPGVRFRSHNLAMVTLVFQAVVIILLREWRDVTGGAEGLNVAPPSVFGMVLTDDFSVLVLTAICCGLLLVPLAILLNGALGKNLRALASNEVGARAYGINVEYHLIAAFTVSSALIAAAAALNAPRYRIIDPDSYGILTSIFTLAYPIVGGMQSLWGGMIGGSVLRIAPEALRPVADFIELFFCVLVIATVLFFPGGLIDLLDRLYRALRPRPAEPVLAGPDSISGVIEVPAALTAEPATGRASSDRTSGSALAAAGVTKRYGALSAVDDVSIEVRAGTLHGLMGPNGAGKTTLFNAISGFVAADAGSIDCFGQPMNDVTVEARIRLGVTRTFQQVAVFPRLTCLDNVIIGLGRNGVWETAGRSIGEAVGGRRTQAERDAAHWALAAVGLDGAAGLGAGSLSLGNQRRLEIARAIVSRPRLILLDEPVSGVGHAEAERLKDLLRHINGELGVTMFIVEHNIGFLVDLCNRLSVMDSGRIVAEGDPAEVVRHGDVREIYFGESRVAE